jgi:ribosomal protein L16 Arg81 hydroxylase
MSKIDFAGFIAPCSIGDFFTNYWEKNLLHQQSNTSHYFSDILDIEDLDNFFTQQNLHPDTIRILSGDVEISSDKWTNSDKYTNGRMTNVVNPDKVFKLYEQGFTIILNSAERTIPRLADTCRAIEQEFKFNIQSNIYITPPNSQGFHKHYDHHDIFLFQVKGPKTWKIYDSGEVLPTSYAPFTREPVLVSQFEMNTGDFLYLPRGVVHEAFSSDVSTIHVNFSCIPKYGFHLLESLAKLAEKEDVFFRRTLPLGLKTEEEVTEYSATFNQKLNELLNKITPVDLLKMQHEKFITNQSFDFKGRLPDMILLEKLNLDSIISRRTGFTYGIEESKKGRLIKFGNQSLLIPAFVEMDVLLKEDAFLVKDIKGLITNQGKLTLINELVKAGFLKIDSHE